MIVLIPIIYNFTIFNLLLCLYFKQIEIGPMQNYVYLIGSTETRKVAVVDAAWEIDTILKIAAQDDVEVTHAFVTHTHPDHVGGHFSGIEIPGVNELLSKCKLKVVVHKAEADALKGLAPSDVIKAESGDKIDVGGVEIQLLHTPGHTPGSQCFLVDGRVYLGRYDVHRCLRPSGFSRRQRGADVLQLDAEVDGAARRHDSFSRPQLRTPAARDYRRAKED